MTRSSNSVWEGRHLFFESPQSGSSDTVTSSVAQVIVVSPLNQLGEKLSKMQALRDDPVYSKAGEVIEKAQEIIQIALTNPSQLGVKTNVIGENPNDMDTSSDMDESKSYYTP